MSLSAVNRQYALPNPLMKTWGADHGETNNVKYYQSYNSGLKTNVNTNTLYGASMTAIPRTTTNNINERQRSVCNLNYIEYHMSIQSTTGTSPMQCNVAVISPKKTGALLSPAGQTIFAQFFRSPGSENTRFMDFSSTTSTLDKHLSPINSDRFRVLSHERFLLNPKYPNTSDGMSDEGTNFKHLHKRIPVGKQVRFGDIDNEPLSLPIYLVYWFTNYQANTDVVLSAVSINVKTGGAFKELCCNS